MSPFDTVLPDRGLPRLRRARHIKTSGALTGWLAARILDHLRDLGLEPGTHVAEQRLADHFQVSRTPVRLALAVLAESGAVAREPNRGFFIARPPAAVTRGELPLEEDDKLYYRIAEDRLNGRIPVRITEAQLVRRYRTTRKRIAATLSRMGHEGWLKRLPGHGWAFEPMLDSVKGYEDGYRFRAAIEPAALRQPGYRLSAQAIGRLREAQRDFLDHNARYTDAQAFDLGAGFHETIVAASGNAFLLDSLQRVNAVRRLFEYRAKRDRASILGQYREHVSLLDLIEAGKLEQAARLMEKHLVGAGKMKARLVSQSKPRG
jgi:DNA-binding GntR family transcriptional regulator